MTKCHGLYRMESSDQVGFFIDPYGAFYPFQFDSDRLSCHRTRKSM